jgi:DNA-binding transcriptional ArsR family regulator
MVATTPVQKPFVIDSNAIKKASSIYRAINHSLRLQIIGIIHKAGSINVTPIIQELKLEQSLISAHLKILRDAKIVKTERRGSNIFYSVNYQEISRISILAENLVPYRVFNSNFVENTDGTLVLKPKEGDTARFTPMELKVIRLVCEENTNAGIAEKLGIGKQTFEDHKSNIIRKMKVRNSVGILFYAIRYGLFKI